MSKQLEALAALLVKGARVTLNAFTIDGKKASNILTEREQLVVDVDDKGISLIVSDPKSAGEMGRRYWARPRESEVEVKGNGFTLTTDAGTKESPKLVYHYSVDKPPVEPSAAAPAKAAAAPSPAAQEEVAGKQEEAAPAKV